MIIEPIAPVAPVTRVTPPADTAKGEGGPDVIGRLKERLLPESEAGRLWPGGVECWSPMPTSPPCICRR